MAEAAAPWIDTKRRAIRAPVNPYDKATVVSIFPVAIDEYKPTIQPGRFKLAPGSYDLPTLLVVGPSSWWREIDDDQPLLEIPNSSIQVADSIVKDYCNGLLESNMRDVMPGLFYINGEKNIAQVKTEYKNKLDEARENQKRWYAALVRMGDILWARSGGNPLSIDDFMRMAARELGLIKDWISGSEPNMELKKCVACGNVNNASIIVCPNCHVVLDKEKFAKMGLTFAS